MRSVIAFAAMILVSGCSGGACSTAALVGWGIPTFGIYPAVAGMACADRAVRQRAADDVDRCVAQGGDPAACRCAIYGCARSNVSVGVYR
jgi:hypothetical protein